MKMDRSVRIGANLTDSLNFGERFDKTAGLKPHLKLDSLPSPKVLTCGSPERAALIAHALKDSRPLAKNREYHTYAGTHQGQPIVVASHGVGSAGAAICFQELIDIGAETLLRLGTAGGLYDETGIGDLVVPTGVIRKDGVSCLMVPAEYPAVADLKLTLGLTQELEKRKLPARSGITLTSDLFYPSLLNSQLEFYKNANAVAVEMECSTLFVIASLRKVRAAALLILDGNPLKWHEGVYDPASTKIQKVTDQAIQVCLDVLVKC